MLSVACNVRCKKLLLLLFKVHHHHHQVQYSNSLTTDHEPRSCASSDYMYGREQS
jgi:hypothetical protein